MKYQIEPMPSWPYPVTQTAERNRFRASWVDTLDLLGRELNHLGVTGVVAMRVVGSERDVRHDGMLRATARLGYHGVALSFQSKHGPLTYPCDTFRPSWKENVRAIALALEALRKVDRYGVGARGEQYAGWRAIEAAPATEFATAHQALHWLREFTGQNEDLDLRARFRAAARKAHPDAGGDPADWARVDAARQLLLEGAR